jgi:hypothetical protein
MRYYRMLALFALFLSALLGACGGGGVLSHPPGPWVPATGHSLSSR